MKKLLIASAITAVLATSVCAEDAKEGETWVAGFAEYYSTDNAESGYPYYLDNGTGFGAEVGYRFSQQWATRFEFSHLNIDASPTDESGNRLGLDALYFLPDDLLYVFGGLKYTKITSDADVMADLGLGKHWDLSDNLKIITEVAAYQPLDNGNSNTHMGLKVGLAYTFGGSSSSSSAASSDSDGDGVSNGQDNCPNTAYGTTVDAYGCAIVTAAQAENVPAEVVADQDGDGIADEADQCANTPSTDVVDVTGCSVFIEEEVSLDVSVQFAKNSSVIDDPNDPKFQELVDFMNRYPSADAIIEGHSSAPGDATYNMALSQKRADAVRVLLVNKYGIDSARINAVGYGETQLLDTSNTAAAHKSNRRITARVSASERVKLEK